MTAGDPDSSPLGRIVRPADYVRVLATPLRLRSPHFAVHHLAGRPLPPKRPMVRAAEASSAGETGHAPITTSLSTELSTCAPNVGSLDVDDSQLPGPVGQVETPTVAAGIARWLGLVVPKRHAKRAVTRTLVKRQIRHVALACASQLEPGLWVVRQRSPFDPGEFPSAASEALKAAARAELRALFDRAVRGERDRARPRVPAEPAGRARSRKGAKTARASGEGKPCAS